MLPFAFPSLPADVETWLGGAASVIAGATREQGTVIPQAEVDARLGWGPIYVRVDLDLRLDPLNKDLAPPRIGTPFPPEWAMIQIGRERYHLRLGVTNPQIGLEDWDEWKNYFPTRSTLFEPAKPGRLLGGEPGMMLDDSTEIFAFGGYDLDFYQYMAGAGITTQKDLFSTWTGLLFYPRQPSHQDGHGPADKFEHYTAVVAGEIYPLDELTIAFDLQGGFMSGNPYFGGQLAAVVLPEEKIHPVVRFEGIHDPQHGLGEPEEITALSVSVGASVRPTEWMNIGLEAKGSRVYGGAMTPGFFGSLSFFRPEPPSYSVAYEEEEEEGDKKEEAVAAPAEKKEDKKDGKEAEKK